MYQFKSLLIIAADILPDSACALPRERKRKKRIKQLPSPSSPPRPHHFDHTPPLDRHRCYSANLNQNEYYHQHREDHSCSLSTTSSLLTTTSARLLFSIGNKQLDRFPFSSTRERILPSPTSGSEKVNNTPYHIKSRSNASTHYYPSCSTTITPLRLLQVSRTNSLMIPD